MIHSYFLENGKLVVESGYPENCQWLNMEGVGNEEVALLKKLGFHELTIEDVLHGGQRMKIEDYKDYLFLSAGTIEFDTMPLNFFCFLSKERIVTIASRELRGDNEVVKHCQKIQLFFQEVLTLFFTCF